MGRYAELWAYMRMGSPSRCGRVCMCMCTFGCVHQGPSLLASRTGMGTQRFQPLLTTLLAGPLENSVRASFYLLYLQHRVALRAQEHDV